MARRAQKTRTGSAVEQRVVYVPDLPSMREPVHYTPAQRALKRRRDREAYEQWKANQLVLIERDRRMRRFFLGAGLTVGTGLLVGMGLLAWWVWHCLTTMSFHLNPGVALGLVIVVVAGAKFGHHCVTTITHSH